MANLSAVNGFYYRIGSMDYPYNMNPDSAFGFDIDGGSAVFKYSINDVEKALTDCRTLTRRANYDSGNTNILLADGSDGIIQTEDISTSEAWIEAFRIMEFISRNQSSLNNNPITNGYLSYGDELLSNQMISGESNSDYVPTYIQGSLTSQGSSHQNRIQWAKFTCKGFTGGNVTFNIYYDADAFVERSENITYKVYRYEDFDSDNTITSDEFKNQIVSKLFDITGEGKYKSWARFTVDKRISDTEMVEEDFYVFSSILQTLTDDVMKVQVKQYLRDKYSDETYLRYTYPTLFDENEIRIIPLYDNKLETVSGNATIVHPLSVLNLSTTLTSFGFNISKTSSDYRHCEIFHVGPGAGWAAGNSFMFNFPILAIEVDTSSGIILPISKRFPSYKPIYGEVVSGDAAEFHFVLITVLGYLMGLNMNLTTEFMAQYSIAEETDTSVGRKKIIFTFAGNCWTVYGPNSVV